MQEQPPSVSLSSAASPFDGFDALLTRLGAGTQHFFGRCLLVCCVLGGLLALQTGTAAFRTLRITVILWVSSRKKQKKGKKQKNPQSKMYPTRGFVFVRDNTLLVQTLIRVL